MLLDTIDKVQLLDPEVNLGELQFISGAFTWLDFRPSDVDYMAQEMANERFFFH